MTFAFPADTVQFLRDLARHNDTDWFRANRARYEAAYVEPAKAFVEAAAPVLDEIVPGLHAEPKVLGSIFRINRDTRFSADKRPYKDHLDFWFWEGERRSAVSGLFVRVAPDVLGVGAGAHHFDKAQLAAYRSAVDDELAAIVEDIEAAGYLLGGETYKRGERLLRHSGLFVHHALPVALATSPELLPELAVHWRALAPLHRWLVARLQPNRRQ